MKIISTIYIETGKLGLANRLASTDTDRKDFNEPLKTYIIRMCVYCILCSYYGTHIDNVDSNTESLPITCFQIIITSVFLISMYYKRKYVIFSYYGRNIIL